MPINLLESLEKKQNAFILKTERVPNVDPKIFKGGKYWNYYMRIFLDIEYDGEIANIYSLDEISFVRYQLHSSYKQPMRIAELKENNFQLLVWTYGFYQFKATIFLSTGSPINLTGLLNFNITEHDKDVIKRYEESSQVH